MFRLFLSRPKCPCCVFLFQGPHNLAGGSGMNKGSRNSGPAFPASAGVYRFQALTLWELLYILRAQRLAGGQAVDHPPTQTFARGLEFTQQLQAALHPQLAIERLDVAVQRVPRPCKRMGDL